MWWIAIAIATPIVFVLFILWLGSLCDERNGHG